MCTAVILRRPHHNWPVIFAANRDELRSRPWRPPGRHWEDRPDVVAGQDEAAGGSWLGLNDHGVIAAILNREGSLGPQTDKRSRGELVLEALDHADAAEAAEQLRHLDARAYRSFNLLIADNRDGFWLRNQGRESGSHEARDVEIFRLPEGLSMFTSLNRNDPESARTRRHLPDLQTALAPEPDLDDWEAWQDILKRRADQDPGDGMVVERGNGFETVSSSLIALPAPGRQVAGEAVKPQWLFAPGFPDQCHYVPIDVNV
ncbi:MAG: NRDE family protein [Pseudomonadota bacterium]